MLGRSYRVVYYIFQLQCFCAAAVAGSSTGAAELEGISQLSLSQQIRRLEQTMGALILAL